MAASSIPAVKAALVSTVLPTVYPAAQVAYGVPSSFQAPDIVSVGSARVTSTQAVLGTQRPRREAAEVDVVLSVFRAGADTQQAATEAAFAMLDALVTYLQGAGNESLGGACSRAWVSSYDLEESDDPDLLERGRYASLLVTLTVQSDRLV
jgi:hypothetical protein